MIPSILLQGEALELAREFSDLADTTLVRLAFLRDEHSRQTQEVAQEYNDRSRVLWEKIVTMVGRPELKAAITDGSWFLSAQFLPHGHAYLVQTQTDPLLVGTQLSEPGKMVN